MSKYILTIFICLISILSIGQSKKNFEGIIYFTQENLSDTFLYAYCIKDNMVRLDIIECDQNIDEYMLFDLDQKTISAVKISRKMYVNIPTSTYSSMDQENFQVIKTENSKKIQGYKCYQWRVKNKTQNTEIAYWVAKDNFNFFQGFLQLWNRSEKHSVYFLHITDTDGYFPMKSEERTNLREQKMTLRVTKIIKQSLDPSLFIIPENFQSYDH